MDHHLMSFCNQVEQLFGVGGCTPNLHMHGHLQECFFDYGPSDSFWLFAFERLNGILGAVSTNNRSIDIQLFMRKILSNQQILRMLGTNCIDDDFKDILKSANVAQGSLKSHQLQELPVLEPLSVSNISDTCKLIPAIKQSCLLREEVQYISSMLTTYLKEAYGKTFLLYEYSYAAIFNNELYGSRNSRHANSSLVYIRVRRGTSEETLKPGFVFKFLKLNVILGMSQSDESSESHIVYFAAVHLLDEHPHKNWFGTPAEVWQNVHNPQVNAFVPIRDIVCRCAYIIT